MEVRKLTQMFYDENHHLVEVLDKNNGHWTDAKTRGYGIVLIEARGLKFGIPLRSVLNHSAGFRTVPNGTKGLDYSKAVLISKGQYISNDSFGIPHAEFHAIRTSGAVIGRQFSKYVDTYVKGFGKQDPNILRQYRYSTLVNYQVELGLVSVPPEMPTTPSE